MVILSLLLGVMGQGNRVVPDNQWSRYPLSRTYLLNQQDITSLKEHKRSRFIGRLFQDPLKGTAPSRTIAENLALADVKGITFIKTHFS